MSSYAQRYLDALLAHLGKTVPVDGTQVLGQIEPESPRQPHVGVFLRVHPDLCVGTTAGLSARPAVLQARAGLDSFELCACTRADSPVILWTLSNLGLSMLAETRPLVHYQSLGGDGMHVLLVPRWAFSIPEGPAVQVVEPLFVSEAQWAEVGPMSLEERGDWVAELGTKSMDQWDEYLRAAT